MKPLITLTILLTGLIIWNGYMSYNIEKKFGKIISAMERENKIIGGN